MKTDKIAQKLADILPNRPIVPGMSNPDTSKLVEQEATRINQNKMQKNWLVLSILKSRNLKIFKLNKKNANH